MRLVLKNGSSLKLLGNVSFYGYDNVESFNKVKTFFGKSFDRHLPEATLVSWENDSVIKSLNSYLAPDSVVSGWKADSYREDFKVGVVGVNTFTSPKKRIYLNKEDCNYFIHDLKYSSFSLNSSELNYLYNSNKELIKEIRGLSNIGSILLSYTSKLIPKAKLPLLSNYKSLSSIRGLVLYSPSYVFSQNSMLDLTPSKFYNGYCLGFMPRGRDAQPVVIYIGTPNNKTVEFNIGLFNPNTREFKPWDFGMMSLPLGRSYFLPNTYQLESSLSTLKYLVNNLLSNTSNGVSREEGMAIL